MNEEELRQALIVKGKIEELEKIKNEIEDTGACEQEVHGKTEFLKGITYCLNIISKYIEELKGDNKQSKCNSCRNNIDELSGECYECVKGIKDNYIEGLKGEQDNEG